MSRLSRLVGRHAGERCFLVANGPSLNRMDLTPLRHEVTIGLNKIYLGFDRLGFYPRYYVAVNATVLKQSAAQIRMLKCVKFLADRAVDVGLQEDGLTYLLRTRGDGPRFSTNIEAGLHEGWTVTHAALQVAYHLGFSEVILIGLDHRYRFDGQPNESRVLEGPDPNHFDPAYFGHGQRWDNPDLARSEASYREARDAFERAGRRILDATVDGACNVFPKVRWPELSLS